MLGSMTMFSPLISANVRSTERRSAPWKSNVTGWPWNRGPAGSCGGTLRSVTGGGGAGCCADELAAAGVPAAARISGELSVTALAMAGACGTRCGHRICPARARHDAAVDLDVDHVARAAHHMLGGIRELHAHPRHFGAVARHRLFDLDVSDRRQRPENTRRQHAGFDVPQIDEHGQRIGLTGDERDRLARLDEHLAARARRAASRSHAARRAVRGRCALRVAMDIRGKGRRHCEGEQRPAPKSTSLPSLDLSAQLLSHFALFLERQRILDFLHQHHRLRVDRAHRCRP